MFSTLFYLFLLFYEGLFSKSTSDYNAEIIQLNSLIENRQYPKALVSAQSILHSRLFNNPEIEAIVATLELRNKEFTKQKSNRVSISGNSVSDDILKSHYLAKYGESPSGLADLHQSIIQNGQLDTLIKAYELFAFFFFLNSVKKQSNSAQMMSQTQKINTQEALSLLDLMKKKQKNLIY